MKKILVLLLALSMIVLCLASCNNAETTEAPTTTKAPETTAAPTEPETKAMTYAEYDSAALETKVVVEGYVQDKQSWWDNKATLYLQDKDGAYFVYNAACSEELYGKLTTGKKVRVEGTKSAWSGEVEIIDCTLEVIEGDTFTATPVDVTELLFDQSELIKYQNQLVTFKGLRVGEKKDADGNSKAFLYKYNGSGEQGDDLYFDVVLQGETFTFTVESYLRGKDTEVYKAVEALQIGDAIDCTGYLYWYNGVNPHIISVTKATDVAMTYDEYVLAELNSPVTIEAYVQAKQSWWQNKGTFYLQSREGAYFAYELPCTEEEYEQLSVGTKVRITGIKSEWSGEVEIIDSHFEILDGKYVATPFDVTEYLGKDEIVNYQNQYVSFTGLTIAPKKDADGNEVAFLYKYNGSGEQGDDLYFDVKLGDEVYTFTVESYLCGKDTEVYKAVEALNIGDTVNLEGFLYWYNGVNPHITSCVVTGK